MRIAKIFKSAMFLSFFATCIDKNYDWFASFLLFERDLFLRLDSNSYRDGSVSNKNIGSGKSKL